MSDKLKLVVFLSSWLFLISPILCSANQTVVINEIAWMGTVISANDEWIELFNNTDQEIDLTGWTLKAIDGTPEITLIGIIAPHGYFLLERTDDTTVPDVAADLIYAGAPLDTGEILTLKNSVGAEADKVDASAGWPGGDKTTKQTMERKSLAGNEWQTSQSPGGTPRTTNSSGPEAPPNESSEITSQPNENQSSQTPIAPNRPPTAKAGPNITALTNQPISFDASQSSDPDQNPLNFFWNFGDGATDTKEKPTHTYVYPGQYLVSLWVNDNEFSDLDIITVNVYSRSIIISEFMPDPLENESENEWIELFNQSDQVANLTGWQLDDQASGSPPFIFPNNSLVAPRQFLVLRRPITKITLNNDQDQVRLFYPDGSLVSQIDYQAEKKQGFSVAFDGQDYFWTKIPTPGAANIISLTDAQNQKEMSINNPMPSIQQTQEIPPLATDLSINQPKIFSALVPESIAQENTPPENSLPSPNQNQPNPPPLTQQSASLNQSSNNQKSNLILILSLIISGGLFISWLLILLKKRMKALK